MSTMRKVATNAGMQYLSRIIGTALGMATLAILTRYLGDAGYGRFTVAASYLQFIGTLVDFGLNITATAMLSEENADKRKILSNFITLRIVSAIVFFGGAAGLAFALPWGSEIQIAIVAGSLSFAFLSVHQVVIGLFQQRLQMIWPAIAEIVGRAAMLAGIALVALGRGNLTHIMLAMSAANFLMVCLTMAFAFRLQPFSLSFDLRLIRRIVSRSWPIAISIIFNLVYLRGDIITMKFVGRPDAEIGWYGAAYKPLDVITVIPIIFMGLVLPLFVKAWQTRDMVRVDALVRRATDAVSLIAFPILFGGLALANPIMVFISGAAFAPAGPLFALLIVAAFTVFYGALFGHLIVGINRQRTMLLVYAADAAVSLALYVIFIPHYGAMAAALITIFSETIIAIAAGIIVVRETGVRLIFWTTGKAFLAGALMGISVAAMNGAHVLVRIVIGAAIYALLIVVFRGVKKDEISLLVKGT
jgi:O-antigen/teichoic acid export membrane protein